VSTTYAVNGRPTTVDDFASTSVAVQNTGAVPLYIEPLGRIVDVGATVTVPGWSARRTRVRTAGQDGTAVVTLTAGTPAAGPGPGGVTFDPGPASSMSVSVSGGTWYTNEGLTTAASFPVTVTAPTVLYPSAAASVVITATVGTTSQARGMNVTDGSAEAFVWTPSTDVERAAAGVSAGTGTYALRVPDWITARAYVVGELAVSSGTIYRCTTAHTSGGAFDGSKFTAVSGGGGASLPTQTGNSGKVLTTDGSSASWGLPAGVVDTTDIGYDVIVCAGQSNMVGPDTAIDLTYYDVTNPRIFRWVTAGNGTAALSSYKSAISLASDPLGFPDTMSGVSPAMEFARRYVQTISPNRKVLIVPTAVQGTPLVTTTGTTWNSSLGSGLYVSSLRTVSMAMAAAGPGSRIVAVLWHQGESDALSSETGPNYQAALDALISGYRTQLPTVTSTTPFVLGGMEPGWVNTPNGTSVTIAAVHAATPTRVANTGYGYGPNDGTNNIHYTAPQSRKLGAAMFYAFLTARSGAWSTATESLYDHNVWLPLSQLTATPNVASGSIAVGTLVTASVAGTVPAIWIPVGTGQTGLTATVKLWASTAAGTADGTASATTRSTPGWQRIAFGTPVSVTAGQSFVVSVWNGTNYFRVDGSSLTGLFPQQSPRGLLWAPSTGNSRFGGGNVNPSGTAGNQPFVDPEFIPA
jgi:hypothetical protein